MRDDIATRFGWFIKKGRLARGMSQTDVAEKLNINQSYYSRIEAGDRNVDLSLAIGICSVLNLDMNTFLKAAPAKQLDFLEQLDAR